MNLLFSLICAAIAYGLYPSGIFDTPLPELTLRKLGDLILAVFMGFYALRNLDTSFKEDRIWPARWKSWHDPASLLLRGVLLVGLGWLCIQVMPFIPSGYKGDLFYAGFIIGALMILFHPDLQIKEYGTKKAPKTEVDKMSNGEG